MRGATEPVHRRPGGAVLDNLPGILLGAAMLISGVLLVALTSHLTWRYDDWDILLYRPGWTAHSLLDPHYEHITLDQVVIYKVLLAIFGMESLTPFSVVSTLVFLLCALLLFVYLRSRVGDWIALMATTVILFLGAAWEDLLWPIQMLVFGSMACGLGMLLALQREDRVGDRLACVLLAGSLSFFSLGLAFAAGAAVDIAQRRDAWRTRIYIVAIPSLLYALWWLGWGHTAENSLTLHDVGAAPLFVLDTIAAGVASLFGLVNNSTSETSARGSLDWGRPLLPVLLLVAAWRFHRLATVPRWFWIVTAIGFSTWILSALGSQVGRPPDASRYQYANSVFILLIAAELVGRIRITRNAMIAVSGIAAVSLLGNITLLFDSYDTRRLEGEQERAVLGAVEISRDTVSPTFDFPVSGTANSFQTLPWVDYTPDPAAAPSLPSGDLTIDAGAYLKAVDDFGSPAYSSGEIATSPEPTRQVADTALAAALRIKLAPAEGPTSPGTSSRPYLIGPPDALVETRASCVSLNASSTDPPLLELPSGGAVVAAGPGGGFEIRLRRFALTSLPVDLGELPAHSSAFVNIPRDRSRHPWKLSLDGSGIVDVCGPVHHSR